MRPGDAGCGPGHWRPGALLTFGIALGSWWAYYELGWGGFWFWDPVENASLLPWLTGTALLHCAIVVEKRETLKTWTVLLAIATFSLSLCGTFMVRSGILNSVHSFAVDPTQGVFILTLLAITIGGSLVLFAFRAPVLAASGVFAPISREGALVLNNVLLCSLCAVVFTGTAYPLFAALFHVQLSVGPPYFHLTVVPLLVPLFLAMSVGPVLAWKRADLAPALLRLWWAGAIAALIGIATELGLHRAFAAAGFAGAAWLILGAFAELVERIRLFRIPLGNSWARLRAQPLGVWGGAIAHAGMGVTVAGIAGMSLALSTIVAVAPGQTIAFGGYRWTLLGVHDVPGSDYTAHVADLRIKRDGRQVAVVHPSLRTFGQQHQTVTTPRSRPTCCATSISPSAASRTARWCCGCMSTSWRPSSGWARWSWRSEARCRWSTGGCAWAPRRGAARSASRPDGGSGWTPSPAAGC